MILRVLNFLVIAVLVLAAAYVYRIKFEATVQAEHLDKLRDEVRHARDKIAALRAEWGELDDPARIQALVDRFLKLKPVAATQFDHLDNLPDQPPAFMRPGSPDPIGGMIEHLAERAAMTGSVGTPAAGDAAATPTERVDNAPPPVSPAPSASGAH